ncbi:MAG: GNAT family N-acetyltransferase [Cellulomonas sp.]|nr:GNAT family N-acetyltransferase [Cellulomonas sp.]
MTLSPPEPLRGDHQADGFDSGVDVLDAWLRRRARFNEHEGASRTFVVADDGRVRAYYTLSAACVSAREVPGRTRRNMPDPIPAVLLGRLAVDRRLQGQGVARALVRDAALRTHRAAEAIGVRCLLVHALSADVAQFWTHLGFTASSADPLLLTIRLTDLAAVLDTQPRP